jgi:hypothetical protein
MELWVYPRQEPNTEKHPALSLESEGTDRHTDLLPLLFLMATGPQLDKGMNSTVLGVRSIHPAS